MARLYIETGRHARTSHSGIPDRTLFHHACHEPTNNMNFVRTFIIKALAPGKERSVANSEEELSFAPKSVIMGPVAKHN